jgi:hypothetical protein
MRQLLIPKYKRFSFDQPLEELRNKNVNEIVEEISNKFNTYLENLNVRATSKHALMGPVGKVLQQAKEGKLDIDFLKGYGIRVHKSDARIATRLDVATLKSFEEGIEMLSKLLSHVPRYLRPRVIELIDYKIYYKREKANVDFWEKWRKDFEDFLKKRHKKIEEMIKECKLGELSKKREIKDFQDIVQLPKKLRTEELQNAVVEFNKSRKGIILEEEGEEE